MTVVVIGAGVAVVVLGGATTVGSVVSVLVVPEAIVVTGGGVELTTAVVLPGVALVVGRFAVPVFPLAVKLVAV
jgi:hypothetical protein